MRDDFPEGAWEIYERALDDLAGNPSPLLFGPAHIVWEDHNWDSVQWCLDHFDEYSDGFENWELDVVRESLEELAELFRQKSGGVE